MIPGWHHLYEARFALSGGSGWIETLPNTGGVGLSTTSTYIMSVCFTLSTVSVAVTVATPRAPTASIVPSVVTPTMRESDVVYTEPASRAAARPRDSAASR